LDNLYPIKIKVGVVEGIPAEYIVLCLLSVPIQEMNISGSHYVGSLSQVAFGIIQFSSTSGPPSKRSSTGILY